MRHNLGCELPVAPWRRSMGPLAEASKQGIVVLIRLLACFVVVLELVIVVGIDAVVELVIEIIVACENSYRVP